MSFAWGPIQMLIACLMFILTVQRERRTQVRIGAVLLAHAVVYVVLPLRTWAEMIRVLAVYICNLSLSQPAVCTFYSGVQLAAGAVLHRVRVALAVQHIFCNVKLVTRQMIGQYFWVDLLLNDPGVYLLLSDFCGPPFHGNVQSAGMESICFRRLP